MQHNNILDALPSTLFWDTDILTIDVKKHAAFIIERVLTRGDLPEFRAIKEYYGKSKLKKIVQQIRNLDERTLHFCSLYFNVPIENFRCYTFRQSNPTHWHY
jgi:hypothetical protein